MSGVPLLEARLEPEDLAALYRDIAVLAEVRSVRTDACQGTPPRGLGDAFEALELRTAHRVQLRYRFDDTDWCDTLIREQDGVRLVRVCEDHVQGAGDSGAPASHDPAGVPDDRSRT
jgi:hypothetical protein